MFGKLYRRSFLEHYNIRMNMSHSNEDTGYNCVVKGCTDKVWYIPKPVYTWRFKPNSITRFNNGMYGNESGMCGYLTNMIWQIKELEKRFVNKNYILSQIISIMCVLYHFYIENTQRYPLGTEANIQWIRYYYEQCYKPYEDLISDVDLTQTFARVAAEQNTAGRGIIPKITFFDWMEMIKSEPYKHDPMHDVGGSVIEIPQTTPEDYPVEVTEYFDPLPVPKQNTNTNLARMDGMQYILDKDKEQRKEFLEKNILPAVAEEEKKTKDTAPVLPDYVNDDNRRYITPHSNTANGVYIPSYSNTGDTTHLPHNTSTSNDANYLPVIDKISTVESDVATNWAIYGTTTNSSTNNETLKVIDRAKSDIEEEKPKSKKEIKKGLKGKLPSSYTYLK